MTEVQQRGGHWIQTFTGKKFYPMDPDPRDIDIVDIAHALSLMTRFAGHCRKFYSVAQHSVYVSELQPKNDPVAQMWGLLHDAAEAYIVDVPRPVKHHPDMKGYRDAETRLLGAIATKFGLPTFQRPGYDNMYPESVKIADYDVLHNEAISLLPHTPDWIHDFGSWVPGLGNIVEWSPELAEDEFLMTFHLINSKLKDRKLVEVA